MAVAPIITVPDKRLFQRSEKVTKFDEETQKLVQDLQDTLDVAEDPQGAGIASPQIGINKRICVVRNFVRNPADPENTLIEEFILINPKIISHSEETLVDYEGCLSVPNVYGKVERFKKVKVQAQDLTGETFRITASDFFSTVIQHEIDHLNGIIFTSKIIGKSITDKELDDLEKQSTI